MGIESRLGVHDIISILIPGIVLLAACVWWLLSVDMLQNPWLLENVATVVGAVAVAYAAGHATHSIAHWYLHSYEVLPGVKPSRHFTRALEDLPVHAAKAIRRDLGSAADDDAEFSIDRQGFWMLHTHVQMHGHQRLVDTYRAWSEFHGSMALVSLLAAFMALAAVLHDLLDGALPTITLLVFSAASIAFLIFVLQERFLRQRFTAEVYRIYYLSTQAPSSPTGGAPTLD